ncbi:MAG: methylthioadenosine phosphorylase [Candidatus Lambdaproteobacteria bacterium RIFOXYD1_FULL_56_27]|uniref:Purine nucleoside phosphorylase n=1 Tax=Candidatus Lambdaproteobacteria bacterium RIFOXYD2_FULL_56_26 TaxID=1817773 RepID=A0A1F6H3J8_9PROT|nr:MAG: methylthioadenosine phosphorylase [Candidatus Lambdaproteobacteria bacterium RIFOXYC1_FULL_56_13]OGH04896.1 MAG: methylthioadenosine phosphorylase [Candidatus Lambdaproteobacteria bacterium RIFOXYD2_FULL_56_26]OGH09361.1 MAG: methylthioadenosine phosphorylase [Candidatus Lambdaproteobacteria bacterium RIFOXYD1_FULL_56_27]
MKFGVIGGSGLYEMEGMEGVSELTVKTPFGDPSDALVQGKLLGKDMVFLPRHGRGHRILPSEINYRANIWAMKSLGVTHLVSVSAVGSLKEEIAPGHIVIPDQFFDRTKDRPSTFFGEGVVAHLQFGHPVCADLCNGLEAAVKKVGVTYHRGGTYVCMEGPLFSTKAESEFYRQIGAAVIGMTNLQEAKLAREAELCFGTIALSTDYDCWHDEEVTLEAVLKVMAQNVGNSKAILKALVESYSPGGTCGHDSSLKYAIMTKPELIPAATKEKLKLIIGKYVS